MPLKRLPVRLKRSGAGSAGGRGCLPRPGRASRLTTLHSCGEPANGSRLRPKRAAGQVAPRSRRAYSPSCLDVPERRLRRACEFARGGAGPPPPGGGLGRSPRARRPRRPLRAVAPSTAPAVRGEAGRTLRRSRWRPNGGIRPVLKHGPRSATGVRVPGWQTRRRNEGEGSASEPAVARAPSERCGAHRRPIPCHAVAGFE